MSSYTPPEVIKFVEFKVGVMSTSTTFTFPASWAVSDVPTDVDDPPVYNSEQKMGLKASPAALATFNPFNAILL